MSRTIHRNAARERQGYVVSREIRPTPRRQSTRTAATRAELAADVDRVTPGVRRPFLSRKG